MSLVFSVTLLAAGLCAGATVSGNTPAPGDELIKAVKAGDPVTVDALLKKGADANSKEANGTTALHWAVYQRDAAMVKRLLTAGANVKVVNEYNSSPMQEAATTGDPAIIKLLLDAGADPESPNPQGQTALMVAARTGNVEAAKLLLKAGAKVNATESFGGQSALMWAAAESQPQMIRLLTEYGGKVNAHSLTRDWQTRVTKEPRPKDRNIGGFTPLIYAARQGCVECAKALVEAHADLDLYDRDRETALNIALSNQHFEFAKYLINAGADVDEWDIYGRTPLYSAVDLATLPTGGRADVPSTDKTTALEVIQLLLEKGADPNIQLKVRPPYRNVPQDRGGDQVLSTGATPLLRASKAGDNPAAIKLLLAHGALVDLPTEDGVTPLLTAAGMGHGNNPTRGRFQTDLDSVVALDLLVKAGADINRRAANGQTAMHAAALKGWTATMKFLGEHGAELEPKDRQGKTPFDYASANYTVRAGPGGGSVAIVPYPETMKAIKDLIATKSPTASKQ